MRALRACDFCADDAVSTFEIVPAELEPTDAEQRRVVLCGDCANRLDGLLEPLLDRLGVDDAGAPELSDAGTESPPEPTADADTAADSTAPQSATNSSSAPVSGVANDSIVDDARTEEPADEFPSADDASEQSIDGITVQHDRSSGADDTEAGEHQSVAADSAPAGDDTRTHPPAAYSKVIRLLRNREFPMDRDAVESLAAGAYDLETHEVEAIVEYAIDQGTFVESGGELSRP